MYLYADSQVENMSILENLKVRDYVKRFEKILDPLDNICKGESDGFEGDNFYARSYKTYI